MLTHPAVGDDALASGSHSAGSDPADAALVVLRGYGPGVASALAINLPFSIYMFRRVVREEWASRGALLALTPAAIVVHGPLLFGAIALAGALVH